jgi:hypothetical protein
MYILTTDLLLLTVTLTNNRPVHSSERALHINRRVTVKQELISGHEPQMGFDFDFKVGSVCCVKRFRTGPRNSLEDV